MGMSSWLKNRIANRRGGQVETDAIAKAGNCKIEIFHINSGKSVQFKAFLTTFKESFATSYDEQYFVMHPEPLRKWKSTIRSINLAWTIPAYDIAEAKQNLGNVSLFSRMLYGEQVSTKSGGFKHYAPKVGGSPIFRIRMLNLIGDGGSWASAATSGLLGYVQDFQYDLVMDDGFFSDAQERARKSGKRAKSGSTSVYPQAITAGFTFYPVHEKTPGWENRKFSNKHFPYGTSPDETWLHNPGKAVRKGLKTVGQVGKDLGKMTAKSIGIG